MLRFLRIRNLAVIEAVDVELGDGFTVLTGETGAGKSIVVEAVGLLLGGRASADLVRTGESQAILEAVFEDGDQELLVRREVTAQGRSRSFVDGEMVTNSALRALSARLVELHGQHEHQALLDPETHLETLDVFGRLTESARGVAAAWEQFTASRMRLEQSLMDERERRARLDLLEFQLGEIDRAVPRDGEDDELAAIRQVLVNAERVRLLCSDIYSTIYDSESCALGQLATAWKRLSELSSLDSSFAPYLEARTSIKAQLEDLALAARRYGEGVDASPHRLQQIEERLALLDRLKKKYGPTLADVVRTWRALSVERQLLTDPEAGREAIQRECTAARELFLQRAQTLSRERQAAAAEFSSAMQRTLRGLAMERARIEMRLESDPETEQKWRSNGIDHGEFFIAPNPGEEPRPLARIVSGGELSRIMLALKTVTADRGVAASASRRTLVFDEVDAGIGGQVAEEVARHLQALGERFQVLCVTHLPQIAARAAHHLTVTKQARGARTHVSVRALEDREARVTELARMIGGQDIGEPIKGSARELLDRAGTKAKQEETAKGESESRRRR